MIIVLYVDDSNQRRWDGPFEAKDAAMKHIMQGMHEFRLMCAAIIIDTDKDPEWIKRYGGTE